MMLAVWIVLLQLRLWLRHLGITKSAGPNGIYMFADIKLQVHLSFLFTSQSLLLSQSMCGVCFSPNRKE